MSDDIHVEPLRGLPEPLPAGERILWQGAPDWRALAVDVFHVRAVWIYGALLIALPADTFSNGNTLDGFIDIGAHNKLLTHDAHGLMHRTTNNGFARTFNESR